MNSLFDYITENFKTNMLKDQTNKIGKNGYIESQTDNLCIINSKDIHRPVIIDSKTFDEFLELSSENVELKCNAQISVGKNMDFRGIIFKNSPRFRLFTYDSSKHTIKNLNISSISGRVYFEIDNPDNFLLNNVNINVHEIHMYGNKFPISDNKTNIKCNKIICFCDENFINTYSNPDDFSKTILKNDVLNNINIDFNELIFMNGNKMMYAVLSDGPEKYEIGLLKN